MATGCIVSFNTIFGAGPVILMGLSCFRVSKWILIGFLGGFSHDRGLVMGLNKDGRINFGMCYMNERYLWGYEVVDTIDNFRICSNFGFKTMEEARQAGFEKAKQIIDEL